MSDLHKITTIEELIDLIDDDNAEVLVSDLSKFLLIHLEAKKFGKLMSMGRVFNWRDDGVTGVSKVVTNIEIR
jgi:hypothetical protein